MRRVTLAEGRGGQALATFLCLLFGIALVLNIHPIGDGLWFWYAILWRNGQRLYADMHLPLQPLFVLLTAWTQILLGKGWLAGKALAAAQVVAYCLGLYAVAGFSKWRDWQNALVISATFGWSLTSFYSRFDDYHITGYIFEVWSLYLLLRLLRRAQGGGEVWTGVALGLMSGLSLANRLNDGGLLFVACAMVLPFCAHRRKLLSLVALCCTAPLTLLAVILLTGDGVRAWATNSIFRAAAIKGGTGNVLASPLGYPMNILRWIQADVDTQHEVFYILMVVALCAVVGRFGLDKTAGSRWRNVAVWSVAALLILGGSWHLKRFFERPDALTGVTMLLVPVLFLMSVWLLIRFLLMAATPQARTWDPALLLLLVPILQIPGTALSSRGNASVLEVFPQAAFTLLLLPVVLPERVWGRLTRSALVGFALWLTVATAITKTWHPYYWHHFTDQAMFVNRTWYDHPVYGPMYIEQDQLKVMQTMCREIHEDGAPRELLTITNPYPNYFCDVPPWHGYVQTWYDTVTKQTVDALVGELETSPPQWIIYQRALDSIEAHERIFNNGKPLPHRALDALIMGRISSGQWQLSGWHHFQGADWIVIKTRP